MITKEESTSRRGFLKGAAVAGAAAVTPFVLTTDARADHGVRHGDVAILRFLAAAELIEADMWQQYTELATGNEAYGEALEGIDEEMPQYSEDTTADEVSHHQFINEFLRQIGADPVNLEPFRALPAVQAEGSNQNQARLTNLRSVNVDTSWFNRYRSDQNPDFGATFDQLVVIRGQATIPTSDSLTADEVKAAAYCAAFHFPTIEQGGTSLYSSLLRKAASLDAVEILAGIGPVEAIHFKIFEGALEELQAFTTPSGISFPAFEDLPDEAAGAVMPKPCTFFSPSLPLCSVVRPTDPRIAGAIAALNALIGMNIFDGQSDAFFRFMTRLAREADAANRNGH
jgi:hypothetical protein